MASRLAVLHHHGDELIEMDELARQHAEVETRDTEVVTYHCPECDTVVTVGVMSSDVEPPLPTDAPG